MNLSVYIPRRLELALRRRARAEHTTPALFVQRVVGQTLDRKRTEFSPAFLAVLGSWEDQRTAVQQVRDIKRARTKSKPRARLR